MTQTDLHAFLGDSGLARTTTLSRESGLRTLLLHLSAGGQIPERQTRGAIRVHCPKGHATFMSGDERVELRPALLIGLAPDMPHSVVAHQDTLLLVTVSEHIRAPSAA